MRRRLREARLALLRELERRLPARARSWLSWPDAQADARRVAVVLGAAAAANLVLFLFVTEPLYRTSEVRASEWEAMERRLDQERRAVARLEDRLGRLQRQKQNLTQFYDVILAEKIARMTAIQREIRSLAGQFQVDPENVSYEPSWLVPEELVQFNVSFPLRGSYENLRQFIHRVESSEHFLIIDDISLADSREGGVVLSLTVRLHTYFKDLEFAPRPGERS
jgi:Tfp pilus assembly protein PilO